MKETILQCRGITKQYPTAKAVDHVDMEIKQGEIYGFIGENGAGKTTLLRMIAGLINPSQGSLSLFGQEDPQGILKSRSRIGCLIEGPAFFPHLTARDNLEYYRIQRGYPDKDCVDQALDTVKLNYTGKKKFQQFSLGMKQRLGVALAIMGKPDFLLLDEPINGLDPTGIIEFREILKRLSEEYGMAILISSHILSELEQVANRYGIIHRGRLVKEFTQEQLDHDTRRFLQVKTGNAADAVAVLEQKLGITEYEVMPGNIIHVYSSLDNPAAVTGELVKNGIELISLTEMGSTLESYFLAAIGPQ